MNNFRHIYIHLTRPNSEQRVSESSSLDDHICENEGGCLGEGLRGKSSLHLFWIQFFYILCGIISEHLIALPGQLWTNTITSALQIWNLWCPPIRNNWQKSKWVVFSLGLFGIVFPWCVYTRIQLLIYESCLQRDTGMRWWELDLRTCAEGKGEESQALSKVKDLRA